MSVLGNGLIVPDPLKLRHKPPTLTTPKEEVIPPTGFHEYTAGAGNDLIGILPGSTRGRQTELLNSRRVQVIGGKFLQTQQESAMLRASGIEQSVFFEGIELLGNNFDLDAIVAGGSHSGGTTIFAPDIYLQNIRTGGMKGEFGSEFHTDGYQPQNPVGIVRIDRCSFYGGYQMLFLRPQFAITEIIISRTNMAHDQNFKEGYPLWLANGNTKGEGVEAISHTVRIEDEVYVVPREGATLAESVFPSFGLKDSKTGQPVGAIEHEDEEGNIYVEFADPRIHGKVWEGPPPGGDFCTSAQCGIGYTTPGYTK